jgi:hypothetical protein
LKKHKNCSLSARPFFVRRWHRAAIADGWRYGKS